MWLLTCEGDLFAGKRIWLRPGSFHLLGRTSGKSKAGERISYIEHKSVSRKHLMIEVAKVEPGDSAKLYARSKITIKDGSKIGTTVNGEKISQETRTLDGKDYTIKLGSYPHSFHLWWHPLTLSFTHLGKKSKDEHIAAQRERFDQTDVKLVTDYVSNETTHAIAKKRNTAAALQALLQAKWLVTDGFVDALASAVTRRGQDGASLLEEDFDANWPNEADYVVETGTEPQPRPNAYLHPNPERTEVFRDYTFIFLSQSQYDNLLPIITMGSGKALLFEVEAGVTEVETAAKYIMEVAGRKGDKQYRLSQHTGKGGIIVVRLNERNEALRKLMRNVDRSIGQQSVEQSELLDAILSVDASVLRKQVTEEPESARSTPTIRTSDAHLRSQQRQAQDERVITVADTPAPAPAPAEPESEQPRTQAAVQEQKVERPPPPAKKPPRRFITQTRFNDFDDFDPSQFSAPASQEPEQSFQNREPSQAPSVQGMEVDNEPSQAPRTQQSSRKRPAPVDEEEENEEDMYASMLTGHAALKRQRTEATRNGETDPLAPSLTAADRKAVEKATKGKKKAKEMDVMAEIQARRQREEGQRQKDEEALREALDGIDISELKDLAKVEEMEVPVRQRPTRASGENGRSERWDPPWNGRKNFKKFRPQGQRHDGPRLQRVIVTLEEVPRKGHGIGDEYWLNTSTSNRSNSKSQSQSQSVRQGAARSQRPDEDDEDSARFRRRLQKSRQEDEDNADIDDVLPEEIAGRARDQHLEAAANSTPSQTFGTDSQRKAAGKRPATQQGGGPAKKARQSRLAALPSRATINLDDDDDDDLKFRRRRR